MTHWNSLEDALLHGYGDERSFLCHVHADRTPSASVNALNGCWICYSCGASGKVDMDGIELDPDSVKRWMRLVQERLEKSTTIYPESWLNQFDALGPGDYWLSRYSEAVCRKHRLGQSPDGTFATIPLRDNTGAVTGLIRRDLTGELRQKYMYPYQAKLSQRLYNYHRCRTDYLLLTEGASDVLAIEEVAPDCSMAMYGARLSRPQAQLLRKYAPRLILVATDQDAAGDKAYHSVAAQMDGYPVVRVTWSDHNDLASMPVEDRADLLVYLDETFGLHPAARVG